ncbi:hypothetical protein IHE44_0007103 [Lamprotornis superbus]|uniref:Uncharacterized protein n=1 Tax=Lamprotornis superbus TaxID=245042 RepID=A0A835NRP9_9PASS|nr:hypothetical protein IHE44_0007103 [Lamprotornis superbus]
MVTFWQQCLEAELGLEEQLESSAPKFHSARGAGVAQLSLVCPRGEMPGAEVSPEVPLEDHVIYSGNIFQYIEENKKWRNRFCVVPHNYGLVLYENKLVRTTPLPPSSSGAIPHPGVTPSMTISPAQAYERELPPRVLVNSAGYKILTSVEQYLELVNNSLPGEQPQGTSAWVWGGVIPEALQKKSLAPELP